MEICPGIFKLNCTSASRCYAVLQPEGVTLIDTSYPGHTRKILAELRDYGLHKEDIRRILLTHRDADHIGNAARLQRETGCDIYIHREDMPFALGKAYSRDLKGLYSFLLRIKCPDATLFLPETGSVGDFEILFTPGHSPGHCCFRYKDVLFLGDLVFSTRDRHHSHPAKLIVQRTKKEAQRRGLDLGGIRWLCPAHAEPIHFTASGNETGKRDEHAHAVSNPDPQ